MQPFQDFILGTKEITFTDLQSFAKYIQVNEGREVELQIYNIDAEEIKPTKLIPQTNWGGQGLIGADISFGYFNRLPLRKKDKENADKRDKMQGIFGKLTSADSKQAEADSDSEDEKADV